jgi:hypothetical protein
MPKQYESQESRSNQGQISRAFRATRLHLLWSEGCLLRQVVVISIIVRDVSLEARDTFAVRRADARRNKLRNVAHASAVMGSNRRYQGGG